MASRHQDSPTLTRAQSQIHDTIALIDAARSKLRANSGAIFPTVAQACDNELVGARGLCVQYLGWLVEGAECRNTCGMLGPNGHGPRIDAAIAAVDFHVERASLGRGCQDALRVGRIAAKMGRAVA